MSNNINDLSGGGAAAGASLAGSRAPAPVAPGAAAKTTEGTGSAADVHITDTASFLASLEPTLREAPAVDAGKVAAIRTAIEQGRYSVHPEHVATQLMQIERALGQLRGAVQPETATPGDSAEQS
jgi:negative regulator of flagellin synthesis FlgM